MSEPRGYLLPRLSLDRPVSVIMAVAALLVVGVVAYTRIPLDLVPGGLEGDRLYVRAGYADASPAEVEREVTRPLEEAIATVPRVGRVISGADRGGAWANVQFLPGTDMHEAYADLRDRIDRAMAELPEEIERVQVLRWNQDDWPVMWIGASLEGEFADAFQLLDVHVRPALQRIEGVGTVEVRGEAARQVRIELDQGRLRGHGVSPYEVGRRLASLNFALPGGRVMEGGRRIHVRSLGRFESLDEVRQLIVDDEHGLRLGDVAEVALKPPKQEWFTRIDGRPALGIEVMKASGGNLVEISRGVRAKLAELQRRPHLEGVDFEIFWDQGEHIVESVDNLKSTGLWGGLFAGLVLLFFLRALRMTLIITLAIPLSVTATVATIYFLGWSLNLITMMGLMLSLGLVVDNAIVIVENIHRRRQEGAGPREASSRTTRRSSSAPTRCSTSITETARSRSSPCRGSPGPRGASANGWRRSRASCRTWSLWRFRGCPNPAGRITPPSCAREFRPSASTSATAAATGPSPTTAGTRASTPGTPTATPSTRSSSRICGTTRS